ncbi:MAG: histidine phosphatase family protein [Oscillospiraceae bacterium]|nr:histidine phosphatase family protein [Oscillospiraceae bacterium]
MKLYLIRHGESIGNQQQLLFGHSDHPLTPLGREQAARVKEKLAGISIDRCFCSPLKRAHETARICFEGRQIPLIPCPSLQEQDMGLYEDMDFPTLQKEHPEVMQAVMKDWYTYCPEGGESYRQVCQRVVSWLDTLAEETGSLAIVAHNGSLSALAAHLLCQDVSRFDRFYFQHGCYSVIDWKEGGRSHPVLRCFNV